ncbi:MAG: hypothetical protein DRN12_05730 [Thermoplasmata archaeon]|nr:MAG: hypothetical protein DRN12_05730 [Thermoplasmata archaeon]
MRISFIGPTKFDDLSLGQVLEELLKGKAFNKATLVSAFANAAALYRLIPHMQAFRDNGGMVRVVVGIDLQSTSEEALRCLLTNKIPTFIFKNRRVGHTFHPKLYYFESNTQCTLIVGSSNLTGGGAFSNYEANLRVDFDLNREEDKNILRQLQDNIVKYLDPQPPLAKPLTKEFLHQMVKRGDVISEYARRPKAPPQETVGVLEVSAAKVEAPVELYGIELMPSRPALPVEILKTVVKANRARRKKDKDDEAIKFFAYVPAEIEAFYMTLNKLQGPNIPGEVRIPIAAIKALPDLWEWPDRYIEITRSRGKVERRYREWKPQWELINGQTQESVIDAVRMYWYSSKKEFRFYSSYLVHWGANADDLIIIRRLEDPIVTYQCEWIQKDNPHYSNLRARATQKVPNPKDPSHPRWWGYA